MAADGRQRRDPTGPHFSTELDSPIGMSLAELARSYDRVHAGGAMNAVSGYYDRMLGLLGNAAGRMLDVGCGCGAMLAAGRALGLDACGLDISPVAVEQARGRVPGADVRVGPAEELPFGDGEFDLVTCMGSLEHVAGPRQAVREMRRVVRPGGRLLLVVPNSRYFAIPVVRVRQFLFPGLSQPVERHSSLGSWRRLFEACDLAVTDVHADNRLYLPGRLLPWLHESVGRLLPLGASYQFAFIARPAEIA